MREMLLLKCGEIILKGANRSKFIEKLIENVNYRLKPIGKFQVYSIQSTIYVEPSNSADLEAALKTVSKIFGIVSISKAAVCEKNLESIQKCAEIYLAHQLKEGLHFKVCAKRSDKRFPLTSPEISSEVGGYLHTRFPALIPDMLTPELTICVEVRDQFAFICAGKEEGAGGMPVGTNGKAALLLSGGIDSPVAGYFMARRGLKISAIHFFSYPYTSEQALEKVISLAQIMTEYCGTIELFKVPFTKIQEQIKSACNPELFTIIMRRFMMKIASKIAEQNHAQALITGESLGQVASQTIEAITVTQKASTLPIFRPLIGFDKEDVIRIARKINTFETSILPYEDCCTVFTPKHPCTKPKEDKVLQNEKQLESIMEQLINEAIANTEKIVIPYEALKNC